MPTYFRSSEADFIEKITPSNLRWTTEGARLMGYTMAAIPMSDDPEDMAAPAVCLLELPPDGLLPRHSHPCHRVEVLVRGSLDVGGGTILGPGDVMISGPGESYGPHIAGPEGSLSVEICSTGFGLAADVDPADIPEEMRDRIEAMLSEVSEGLGSAGPG